MTHTADNTDRQEGAVIKHRAHARHRHNLRGWYYRPTCACGWAEDRDYLTREEAMAVARQHRFAEPAPSSSVGGTTTSSEDTH